MAQTDLNTPIYILNKAVSIIGKTNKDEYDQSILKQAINIYFSYYYAATEGRNQPDPNITPEKLSTTDLGLILEYLYKLQTPPPEAIDLTKLIPKKEESTIPADLESLVYQYQESLLEDKIENDNSASSVAETVLRARKKWNERNRIQTILKNRDQKQIEADEKESEKFFVKNIDPKLGSKEKIQEKIEILAVQIVDNQAQELGLNLTKAQKAYAVEYLSYQGTTGFDIANLNNQSLLSQIAFRDAGAYFDSPINDIDLAAIKVLEAERDDPYSNLPEEEKEKLQKLIQKPDPHFTEKLNNIASDLDKSNKSKNIDYDNDLENAKKSVDKIQTKLSSAIKNPREVFRVQSPLERNAAVFEKALREEAKITLNDHATYAGATAATTLSTIGSRQKNYGPETVNLFSKGLTLDKLKIAEDFAKAKGNENTVLGKLFKQDVFKQVRKQLGFFHKSELAKEVAPKFIVPRAVKILLNPLAAAREWAGKEAGKQIGKRILAHSKNILAKQAGEFLIKSGLKKGTLEFAAMAGRKLAVKAVTWAAIKLGVSLTAESLNAIMPGLGLIVDIAIQVALVVIEKTVGVAINLYNDLHQKIFGEKATLKDAVILPTLAGIGFTAIAATGTALAVGFFGFMRATKLAAISAVGIIIICLIAIGLYITFSFAVAPMLSTLVQLDSVEKVKYPEILSTISSCSNVPWPFPGTFAITQGPRNSACTHHGTIAESADFATPIGTRILSMFAGKVDFAGSSTDGYGINVKMTAITDSGKRFSVIYGHFSKVTVTTGSLVQVGTQLGLSGSTGYSTGPHLHLGYLGIEYNSCPAGNLKIKENCCSVSACNQP